MKSICDPFTPPAALICLTASFAPFAAGRSSADSSPVSAKPPPILIVPPAAALLPPPPDAEGLLVVHAATRRIALTSAIALRAMTPPQEPSALRGRSLTGIQPAYDDRPR